MAMPTDCSSCIAKIRSQPQAQLHYLLRGITLYVLVLSPILCNAAQTFEQAFTGGCGISSLGPPNQATQDNSSLTNLPSFAAEADEVPWQARILVDGKFKCSAAIVSSQAVSTSASCLDRALGKDAGGIGRIRVIVGAAFDFRAGRYGDSVFKVKRVLTHGNYISDPNKNINDLASVVVDGSIGGGQSSGSSSSKIRYVDQAYVRPACIIEDGSMDLGKPNQVGVMSFWMQQKVPTSGLGALDYGTCDLEGYKSSYIPLPYKAWLRIVPTEQCLEYFPINRRLWPTDHYICAQADPISISANICCAEGGAPFTQKFGDRWFLVGLFTSIAGCQYDPVGEAGTPPLLLFASTTGTQVSWMQLHQPDDPEATTAPPQRTIQILASTAMQLRSIRALQLYVITIINAFPLMSSWL